MDFLFLNARNHHHFQAIAALVSQTDRGKCKMGISLVISIHNEEILKETDENKICVEITGKLK
jgi:hypothetical protein